MAIYIDSGSFYSFHFVFIKAFKGSLTNSIKSLSTLTGFNPLATLYLFISFANTSENCVQLTYESGLNSVKGGGLLPTSFV